MTIEVAQVGTREGQWGSVMGIACLKWGQGLGPKRNPKPENEGLRSKRGGGQEQDKETRTNDSHSVEASRGR